MLAQLPERLPDTEWPVEPKPPRELEVELLRELELVDVEVVPLRPEVSAVETDVGARLENSERERLDDA